jgi:hypothetical protein
MVVHNLASAFDLDEKKLMSDDASVSAPERAKLQQRLIDEVHDSVATNGDVKAAKTNYDAKVHQFAAGHNSVVASAGNEGDLPAMLAADNGGASLRIPSSFYASPLANQDTTLVGATKSTQQNGRAQEGLASYTTPAPGVSVYADGDVSDISPNGKAEEGTSFSAPRVADTMAALHRTFPNLNHRQIENLMLEHTTHALDTAQGAVAVLDPDKTLQFLAHSTH